MKKLLIICVTLIFSSCAHKLPTKPIIDLCSHNMPNGTVPCVNNQTGESYVIRIEDTDKYIMLSPDDWAKILFYIRSYTSSSYLIQNTTHEKTVKRELVKLLNASYNLKKEVDGI